MGVVQEDQVNQTKKVASIMMIKICVGVSAHIKTTQYISIFVTLRTPAPMKTIAMLAVTVIVGTRGLDQQQTHAYLRLLDMDIPPDCPEGWADFDSECYKVFQSKKSWQDAENYCQGEGGHLASIHSEEENNFVAGLDS